MNKRLSARRVGNSPRWTFGLQEGHWRALGRFSLVAVLGLALNSAMAYGISDRLRWHYAYAVVAMVTATPVVLFLLSRCWAFAKPAPM